MSFCRNFRAWTWSAYYWFAGKEVFSYYQRQGSSPSFHQTFEASIRPQVGSSWKIWQEVCEIIVHGKIQTHIIELCWFWAF